MFSSRFGSYPAQPWATELQALIAIPTLDPLFRNKTGRQRKSGANRWCKASSHCVYTEHGRVERWFTLSASCNSKAWSMMGNDTCIKVSQCHKTLPKINTYLERTQLDSFWNLHWSPFLFANSCTIRKHRGQLFYYWDLFFCIQPSKALFKDQRHCFFKDQNMGNALLQGKTQCVRCYMCGHQWEQDLPDIADMNSNNLATGMPCKSCGKKGVGISAYETGSAFDRKIDEVIGKIRTFKNYSGPVFVVDTSLKTSTRR